MSINNIVFTGNCGRDMEVRHTPNGKIIGNFSLPLKSGWGQNEKTNWVECSVWGEKAQKLSVHVVKGKALTVQGELGVDTWEDKVTGLEKWKLTCNVNQLAFGSPPSEPASEPVQLKAVETSNADIWGDPPF